MVSMGLNLYNNAVSSQKGTMLIHMLQGLPEFKKESCPFILPCAQEWDPAAASVLLFVVADVTGL
jgi:hypothetical protein